MEYSIDRCLAEVKRIADGERFRNRSSGLQSVQRRVEPFPYGYSRQSGPGSSVFWGVVWDANKWNLMPVQWVKQFKTSKHFNYALERCEKWNSSTFEW